MNSSDGVKSASVGKNRSRRRKKASNDNNISNTRRKMKSEFEYLEEEEVEVEDQFHPNNEACRHHLDVCRRENQKIKLPKSNPDNSPPVIYGEFPDPEREEAYQRWLADDNNREALEKELKSYYDDDDNKLEELEKELKKNGKMFDEELQKELKNKYDEELEKELKNKYDE